MQDGETLAVLQKLTPSLDQKLEAKGFHCVAWGSAGWVQLFSKTPLRDLNDVKKAKLFTSAGDDRMVQWYKSNGFNPVALAANDIPAQLKLTNGMIDAAPSPPYPAMMLQIFRDAKYMLDVHVAPLLDCDGEGRGHHRKLGRHRDRDATRGEECELARD